jgi:hypothetical protein
VYNVSYVRQIEVYTAEPLIPGPSCLGVEISIAKLKNYKEPIHKKGDKTDCNNYHGISLLSTSCKHLSNIHLSRLGLYINEINGDHQCWFWECRSTTDQIFCSQILNK